MQYETIFDIASSPGPSIRGIAIAACVLALFLAARVVPSRDSAPGSWTAIGWLVLSIARRHWRAGALLGMAGLALAAFSYRQSDATLRSLRSAASVVVEGPVAGLAYTPAVNGHNAASTVTGRESFTVSGHRFADASTDPGTPFPLSQGTRSIANGQLVRIGTVDGRIVKVERQRCLVHPKCSVRYVGSMRIETE